MTGAECESAESECEVVVSSEAGVESSSEAAAESKHEDVDKQGPSENEGLTLRAYIF